MHKEDTVVGVPIVCTGLGNAILGADVREIEMLGECGRLAIVAGADSRREGQAGKLIYKKVSVLLLGVGGGYLVACAYKKISAEFFLDLGKRIYPRGTVRLGAYLRVADKGELKITEGVGGKIVNIGVVAIDVKAVDVVGIG